MGQAGGSPLGRSGSAGVFGNWPASLVMEGQLGCSHASLEDVPPGALGTSHVKM